MLTGAELEAMRTTVEATFSTTAQRLVHSTDGRDRFGNPVESWDAGTTYPCRMHRYSGTGNAGREITQDRNTQISDWTMLLPFDAEASGRDRWLVDGVTYEQVGPPEKLGFETHMRVALIHVDG